MTRPYIKLDPGLPERKDYYPDGAFRALVETFCNAAHQHTPGIFRSRKILAVLLGKRARWISHLLAEGDLRQHSDGTMAVVNWDVWQEGKYGSVAERMKAIRDRRGPMTPADRAFMYRQRQKAKGRDESRDASRDDERDAGSSDSDRTPTLTVPDADEPSPNGLTPFQEKMTRAGAPPPEGRPH